MESMREIFIRKYEEVTGKKCDEMVLSHMKYAIEAGEEYARQRVQNYLNPPDPEVCNYK